MDEQMATLHRVIELMLNAGDAPEGKPWKGSDQVCWWRGYREALSDVLIVMGDISHQREPELAL